MTDRTCNGCGKVFTKPCWLRNHGERKTPCAPILERTDLSVEVLKDPDLNKKKCHFCGRVFTSYTSMRRHVRNACNIAPNTKNGDAGMEVLYDYTIRRQQVQIEALATQNAEMAARQDEMLSIMREMHGIALAGPQANAGEVAIQNHDHGQVAVDNRKFNINVFGKEGLDHATVARIKEILDESIRAPALPAAAFAAVLKTAMLVYSDPDHPENLTCYLPNKKTNDVLVHAEEGWEVQPASLVLPPMAQKSMDTIFGQQPYENADEYGPLMKELAVNEAGYTAGTELRPILVRNKDLLARALESLPVVGRISAAIP